MVDFQRKRSPGQIAKAIADYGEELTDPKYQVFAMLVARGSTAKAAYKQVFPNASDATAEVQASILCAHPDMAGMVAMHSVPPRDLAAALVPQALEKNAHLMEEAKSEHVQLRASENIMDRGGLPAGLEVVVTAQIAAQEMYRDVIEAEVIDDDDTASSLEQLERDREEWAKMLPESNLAG